MDVSSVSDFEYVSLVGQYNQLELGKTNSIDPRLLTRLSDEQIKTLQDEMGTGSDAEVISINLHFTTLGNWDYDKFNYILTLYSQYDKNGVLPYPGSHSEQPAKIMDILNIVTQLRSESELRQLKNQKSETDRKTKVNGKR